MKIKCKATILAIDHWHGPPLVQFSRYLSPGKTLYIEYPEIDLERDLQMPVRQILRAVTPEGFVASYTALAKRAVQRGMQVVALDNRQLFNIFKRMKNPQEDIAAGTIGRRFFPTDIEYTVTSLRERKWALRLRKAKKGDLVVMHPIHAFRIAPLLGISRLRIKWFDYPSIRQILYYRRAVSPKKLQTYKDFRKRQRQKARRSK